MKNNVCYISGMISIIIPVYNNEFVLGRCLNSILSQTYANLEIIVIDDGSKDCSYEVVKSYAAGDERIKCYQKENGGVSSARNYGLCHAKGEYVMFVDSDDWVDKLICEKMVNEILSKHVEWVICGFKKIEKNNETDFFPLSWTKLYLHDYKEICREIISTGRINSPWTKLYLHEKISFSFNEDKSMGEDLEFNLAYAKNISSISCIQEPLYYYDCTGNSSLSKTWLLYVQSDVDNMILTEKFLTDAEITWPEYHDEYFKRFLRCMRLYYKNCSTYKEFKKAFFILKNSGNYNKVCCEKKPKSFLCRLVKSMIERNLVWPMYSYIMIKH